MKLLIFAGTSEGRRLAETLSENHINATVSVATDYGELVMPNLDGITVRKGRMDLPGMEEFIRAGGFDTVVDATHPYARVVSSNIKSAAKNLMLRYIRLVRDTSVTEDMLSENVYFFSSPESAAEALKLSKGNILLTTGVKDISTYALDENVLKRLYARILPGIESMTVANDAGITAGHIIAMQGPFSEEMNEALIREFDIKTIVTKESGKNGGFREKLIAAKKTGATVFVISHETENGSSYREVLDELSKICDKKLRLGKELHISLVGAGMGNTKNLTVEALDAVQNADLIFGAERLVRNLASGKKSFPIYKPEEILSYIEDAFSEDDRDQLRAAVLYSGDIGIFSGAAGMREMLSDWDKGISVTLNELPGISSVGYLAAKLGESWDDAKIISIHGKKFLTEKDVIKSAVSSFRKTFILVSGKKDVEDIYGLISKMDNGQMAFAAGYNLSLNDERLFYDTSDELPEGLYTIFVKNNSVNENTAFGYGSEKTGISNADLILSDKVPVTKEEVRKVILGKLRLSNKSVLYDIGAGTGSVTVDAKLMVPGLKVYAFEKEKDRVLLIKKNIEKFGISDTNVLEGRATETLGKAEDAPTNVFIGGTEGEFDDIIKKLRDRVLAQNIKTKKKGYTIRVVVTAITMDMRSKLMGLKKERYISDYEYVEMNISRSKPLGSVEMLSSENPVAICSFNLC